MILISTKIILDRSWVRHTLCFLKNNFLYIFIKSKSKSIDKLGEYWYSLIHPTRAWREAYKPQPLSDTMLRVPKQHLIPKKIKMAFDTVDIFHIKAYGQCLRA